MGLFKKIKRLFRKEKELRTCQDLLLSDYSLFPGKPFINSAVITYHLADRTPDMMPAEVDEAVDKVFTLLAPVFSPIRFAKTTQKASANIVINFASNGDNDLPFAFEETTLGYAFAPRRNKSTIWLNDKYNWDKLHSRDSINLTKVLLHEALHSLGLGHTNEPGDIMQPSYSANNSINITQDSRKAVDVLYGDLKKKILDNLPTPEPEAPEEPKVIDIKAKEILRAMFPSAYYTRRLTMTQKVNLAKVFGLRQNPRSTLSRRIYDAVKKF